MCLPIEWGLVVVSTGQGLLLFRQFLASSALSRCLTRPLPVFDDEKLLYETGDRERCQEIWRGVGVLFLLNWCRLFVQWRLLTGTSFRFFRVSKSYQVNVSHCNKVFVTDLPQLRPDKPTTTDELRHRVDSTCRSSSLSFSPTANR